MLSFARNHSQAVDHEGKLCHAGEVNDATSGWLNMITRKRNFPPGVNPQNAIALREFLPYRIHALSAKIARPADFTLANGKVVRARDWRVILQLASRGPLTNRELSAMVGLDAANITRVVQYLGELGLVTTRTSTADRRKQIISLTAEGAAAHDAIAPKRKEFGESLLDCFSETERDRLFEMFDRLEQHIQDDTNDDEWLE